MNARSVGRVLVCLSLVSVTSAADARQTAPVRKISISVGDPVGEKMTYSVSTITAKPGEKLRIQIYSTGQLPKNVMAHNWVLLKAGSNPKAFAEAAGNARATDFIPVALKGQILAESPLLGPGERFEITITAPKVPGKYPYLCTFPGHFAAGMSGDLIVK